MLINSELHDYYDNVHTFGGVDKSIVYNREYSRNKVRPKIKEFPGGFYVYNESGYIKHYLETAVLYFCGTSYPLISYYSEYPTIGKKFFEYSPEFAKGMNFGKRKWKNDYKNLENFFIDFARKNESLNLKYKSPIVLVEDQGYRVIVDPLLKDIEFYKVIDPFATFQEIEIFIGSMLCTEKQPKPDNVEDRYKIEQKGFDKFSFRKPKQEKK